MDSAREGASLILVVGPTAVGKSGLAMALAERLPIEIVNGDALQVYKGLDIGTAKPSHDDRRAVPHHLVDILDPAETFSAGDFRRLALPILEQIRARGRIPVVVGGSGFYLRTLVSGISPVPEVPAAVKARVAALSQAEGLEGVRARLRELDPEAHGRLEPGDAQRNTRALEVVVASGRGLADWWSRPPSGPVLEVTAKIGLTLPRTLLYDRIARRVARMLEDGWVEEVRRLLAEECSPSSPAFQAIGYRHVVRHISGGWPLERVLEETTRDTRRFAKRQLTWFRRERDVQWFDANALSDVTGKVFTTIRDRLGD